MNTHEGVKTRQGIKPEGAGSKERIDIDTSGEEILPWFARKWDKTFSVLLRDVHWKQAKGETENAPCGKGHVPQETEPHPSIQIPNRWRNLSREYTRGKKLLRNTR